MYERFSDPARRAVRNAQQEARLMCHEYVGTEHLLSGLSRVTHGVAAQVLQECGADSETIAAVIAEQHRAGITEAMA